MRAKTHATFEDLYKVEGKAELVNGEIIEIPWAGDDPGRERRRDRACLRQTRYTAEENLNDHRGDFTTGKDAEWARAQIIGQVAGRFARDV